MHITTLAMVAGIGQLLAAADATRVPSGKQLERKALSRNAIAGSAAGAAIQQAQNSPHEWEQGWAGFGKRFASGFAKHAVKGSIQLTVGTIRHEDLVYRPSGKQGFKPRLKYALLSTVITRKTTTGKKTFASGEVSGATGAGFISRLWQPVRLHTVASGMGSAGVSLGVDAGFNVVREFWPEIRHPKRARKSEPRALATGSIFPTENCRRTARRFPTSKNCAPRRAALRRADRRTN